MLERERLIVGTLTALVLFLALGFIVHVSPRFAGSTAGVLIGIAGSALMAVPLLYMAIKRIAPLRRLVTRVVSMRTLLAWHIYAGVYGPLLVIVHSGHKFDHPLGIALTALTLIILVSGFIGRYLYTMTVDRIREHRDTLVTLHAAYGGLAGKLARKPGPVAQLKPLASFAGSLLARPFLGPDAPREPALTTVGKAVHLAGAIADQESAIIAFGTFKTLFRLWLNLHIVLAFALYVLLGLHVVTTWYFGWRWLP